MGPETPISNNAFLDKIGVRVLITAPNVPKKLGKNVEGGNGIK